MATAQSVTLSGPSGVRIYGGKFDPGGGGVLSGSVALADVVASGALAVGAAPPPPPPTGNITQFLTSDGGTATDSGNFSGPTRGFWHKRLGHAWKRMPTSGILYGRGNWLDAAQVEEGSTPYASTGTATTVGQTLSATVTTLVQRWRSNGLNRGFYLNARGSVWPLDLYGRGNATDSNRPKLTVITNTGTFILTAAANATWNSSSFNGNGSKNAWRLVAISQPAILRFDLSSVTGTVTSATLTFVVSAFDTGHTGHIVDVYELDPPTMIVPENPASPVLGIQNGYANFNAFKASGHASLLAADDFELGGPFDTGFTPAATRTLNPDTGTTYARGEITVGWLGSANSRLDVSRGTGTRGTPDVVRPELFGQYSIYLEADFGTTADTAIKVPAMGVQFGYWNPAGGGYWQQTTGNGGFRGTGLKVDNGGASNYEYQGHSTRFLTGVEPTAVDDDPYRGWFGIGIYDYNLDQAGPFPAGASFPYITIRKEQWYTVDIRVKQNTMTGAQDALGNYATANPDGIYQVWVNGVAAYSKTDYRWRLHDEFGVQGVWIDVYHGGTDLAPSTMHYRVDRVSVATAYIGPKVVPIVISGNNWTPNRNSDNDVLATDWAQLPLNTWVYAATNTLSDALGPTGYPTSLGNTDGRASIMTAWCGAAWDWINGKMYVSGGGHSDSHICENGIYCFDKDTMRWTIAKARTAKSNAQKYNVATTTFETGFADSDGRNGSANSCMADGSPGASHTYDALNWIPPSVVGNTNGAILMFHYGKEVLDLDTGTYDTSHVRHDNPSVANGEVDMSYKIVFMDGWNAYHARASFQFRQWDFSPSSRSTIIWSTYLGGGATSRGAFIRTIGGDLFEYGPKALAKMEQRREIANFSGSGVKRLRYGQAIDAGNTTDWTSYSDSITLTSSDGSHTTLTTGSNYVDASGSLFACGAAYDATGDCIWIVSNFVGGPTYKVSGISTGNTWTTEIVSGASNLASVANGTYERCRLFTQGPSRMLMRATTVTNYTQIMRVA